MITFHNITVLLLFIVAGVLSSSLAMAIPNKVSGGYHDFSVSGGSSQWRSATETEVCIFCHTPHNAKPAKFLWNKAVNNNSFSNPNYFRLYTSSATLTSVTKASSLTASSPSLLCLSCHDGKTAINVLHNSRGGTDASGDGYPDGSRYDGTPHVIQDAYSFETSSTLHYNLGAAADGSNGAQGDDLTNDHPIGFSYSEVLAERSVGLHTLADAKNAGIRFFDIDGKIAKVECSSCHNPHADYSPGGDENLRPFLVKSNVGSALCLSCHDK